MLLRSHIMLSGAFSAVIFLSACSATLPDSYYDDIAYESAAVNICQRQGMMDSQVAQLSRKNNAYILGLGSYDKSRLNALYQQYMVTYQNGIPQEYCQSAASSILEFDRTVRAHKIDESRRRTQDMNVLKGMIPTSPEKVITRCRTVVGIGHDVECETSY